MRKELIDEIRGTNIDGTEKFLYELALKNKKILEIGVRFGISTTIFLSALKHSDGKLVSIDTDPCPIAKERIKRFQLSEWWEFIQGNSLEVAKTWNQRVDFVFLDSGHSLDLTLNELEAYKNWTDLIILHDTLIKLPECQVWEAVQQFLIRNRSWKFKELNLGSCGLGKLYSSKPQRL